MEAKICCPAPNSVDNIDLIKEFGDNLPVVHTLDDLIRELRKIFDSDNVNIELVDYVMRSYKTNYADWKKYAKFDRMR